MGLYDDISNSLVPSPLDYGYVPPFPSQGAMPEPYQSIYPPGYVRQGQPPYTDFINPPIYPNSNRQGLLTRYPVDVGIGGDYDSLIGGNLPQQPNYPAITVDPGYTSNWLGAPGGAPASAVGDAGLQGGGGGAGSYPPQPGASPGGMMGDPNMGGLGAGGRSGAGGLGLLSAGLGILAQSGWQPGKGVTVGQALGIGGAQGVQTYLVAKQQEERAAIAREQIASMNVMRRAQIQDLAEKTASRQRTNQLMRQLATAKTQEERLAVLNQLYPEEGLKAELKAREPFTLGKDQTRFGQNGQPLAAGPQGAIEHVKVGVPGKPEQEQTMGWNSKTGAYDIPIGGPVDKKALVEVGVNAYEKKSNEKLAEQMDTIQKAGLQAGRDIARYQELGSLLSEVGTGRFTGTTVEIKRIAKAAGIDLGIADNIAPAQAAQMLSRQMALELRNPAGGAGMPGALSDSDRNYLESMLPNLESDPKAWPKMVDYYTKIKKRDQEVAKLARDYAASHNGQLDYGFYQAVEDHGKKNPLFERRVKRTGVDPSGKKVIEYDDGSIEVAP